MVRPQTLNQDIIFLINIGVEVVFALGMKVGRQVSRWVNCQILLIAIPIIKYIITTKIKKQISVIYCMLSLINGSWLQYV